MKPGNQTLGARLRVVIAPDVAIGPGKADLLQGIRETGSIAAAGRRMKMSYKRAWLLIEALNEGFGTALVETTRGGSERGGARLTATGDAVLDGYRRMEDATRRAVKADVAALKALVRDR